LRRTKTADELEAAAPERAQEIATGLIETPDLNKDGRTDAQEQEVADKATGFLASIKAWFKNVTGAAKKPVASEEMDPGYVYEIINPTIGRPTGTGDSINFIRTEKEIAELWYKAPRSFVVKLAMPTENRYGSKGRLQKYITMKMIEDSRNDNQTITLVHDKEGSSSETEFILSGMTKLNIKITSVVSEDAATTDASSDDSGAAEGTSPDSFITFPQDIPLAIFNPRTSNFETEYFKYLTCTSDDGNDVEPSEITSIDISAKEPQSLRPRAENQNEHITITIFFTDNTIYQQDIKSSNLEVSSKTLRITLGDERISNTNPTKISSRQHRVYPNLGTNWDTKLTPKKTLRIPKDGPAAGRNVSDNEDPESRGRSSSLGRQITETTADPFAS